MCFQNKRTTLMCAWLVSITGLKIRHFSVLGRVVRKTVNTNPGLKINRSINFSSIKMFFTSYVLEIT